MPICSSDSTQRYSDPHIIFFSLQDVFVIDVQFASGIKIINFGFTLTPMCVLMYFPPSPVKTKITGILLGWECRVVRHRNH